MYAAHQKRASRPFTDGYKLPYGFWKMNSGPLEEQKKVVGLEENQFTEMGNAAFLMKWWLFLESPAAAVWIH